MFLRTLLLTYRKRRAIHLYLNRLGPTLARLFGKAKYYTPQQVEQAAREAKLPTADLCYGLATYCTPEDFNAYHTAHGESCNYWEMRVEVGDHGFHGNASFSQQDVAAHAEAHSHHSGGGFDGGHHGGGGFDGGGHHGGGGFDGGGHH